MTTTRDRLLVAVSNLKMERKDIAEKMGYSYSGFSKAINDESHLTSRFINNFCKTFDVDEDWIYGRKTTGIKNVQDVGISDLKLIRKLYKKSLDDMSNDLKISRQTLKTWEYVKRQIPEYKKDLIRHIYKKELEEIKGVKKEYVATGTLLFKGDDDSFEAEVQIKIIR